ncbi:MAG TPA: carbamoyltransferase HypF, partial [Chloroflexota bacterium]|nr:carbamoyltransferase HypF [Chloroflexota bacterium]
RVAHLRTFTLPGGERAIREPRRSALGLLHQIFGDSGAEHFGATTGAFSGRERAIVTRMLAAGINAPRTSSAGRLFDAVASLTGLRQVAAFEGQAAMDLEFALEGVSTDDEYCITLRGDSPIVVDWEPAIRAILGDLAAGIGPAVISARFHNTLAAAIAGVVGRLGGCDPALPIVLSGGCFQNQYLLRRTVAALERQGSRAYWQQRVPTNDGGIALGQIAAVWLTAPLAPATTEDSRRTTEEE